MQSAMHESEDFLVDKKLTIIQIKGGAGTVYCCPGINFCESCGRRGEKMEDDVNSECLGSGETYLYIIIKTTKTFEYREKY